MSHCPLTEAVAVNRKPALAGVHTVQPVIEWRLCAYNERFACVDNDHRSSSRSTPFKVLSDITQLCRTQSVPTVAQYPIEND